MGHPGHALFTVRGTELTLLCERAIFWEEKKSLIVSDIHLGKVGHFRKYGIAIPKELVQEDLAILSDLLGAYQPTTLYILGDLFHSQINQDWHWFTLWRAQFKSMEVILIKGNHDIISDAYLHDCNISIEPESMDVFPFRLIHDMTKKTIQNPRDGLYTLSGHIHPGMALRGKGKQTERLPCFYFHADYAILPAFGRFTGCASVKKQGSEKVFLIADKQVIPLS